MKTYEQLTKEEQERALEKCRVKLLTAIVEGQIRFADDQNKDDLQGRIDAAIAKAEEMQTPWFAHEYVMDTCAEAINGMAQCNAEDSLYPEPGERVLVGVIAG
jgi:hypothetical protein